MRIELLTAAKSTALLTSAQVKARSGFAAADTTTLDALIAAASAAAVSFILGSGQGGAERALVAQQYRVTQQGPNRDQLLLPRRPIDPSTVAVSIDGTDLVLDDDYSIESAAGGSLYRSTLWPSKNALPTMAGEPNVQTTFWAGWVPPAVSYAYATGARAAGDWILPTNPATSPLRFRVKTGGTFASTEPDWSAKAAGDEFTVDDVVLVAHALPDAPANLTEGAMFAVMAWYRGQRSAVLAGVAADQMGPHRIEMQRAADFFASELPGPTKAFWEGLRP